MRPEEKGTPRGQLQEKTLTKYDPATGQPVTDPATGEPVTMTVNNERWRTEGKTLRAEGWRAPEGEDEVEGDGGATGGETTGG